MLPVLFQGPAVSRSFYLRTDTATITDGLANTCSRGDAHRAAHRSKQASSPMAAVFMALLARLSGPANTSAAPITPPRAAAPVPSFRAPRAALFLPADPPDHPGPPGAAILLQSGRQLYRPHPSTWRPDPLWNAIHAIGARDLLHKQFTFQGRHDQNLQMVDVPSTFSRRSSSCCTARVSSPIRSIRSTCNMPLSSSM